MIDRNPVYEDRAFTPDGNITLLGLEVMTELEPDDPKPSVKWTQTDGLMMSAWEYEFAPGEIFHKGAGATETVIDCATTTAQREGGAAPAARAAHGKAVA